MPGLSGVTKGRCGRWPACTINATIPQGNVSYNRVDSGRGQNRTSRLLLAFWPPVFAGEQNLGPSKGRHVGQQIGLDGEPRAFPLSDTFAEFEANVSRMRTRESMAVARTKAKLGDQQPKLTDRQQRGTPRASILSARSLRSSHPRDQPSIAVSTAAYPVSVRSCPLPESTPFCSLSVIWTFNGYSQA